MGGRFCLSNLTSFHNRVAHLADQGKPVDVILLDFSKALKTLSHNLLLDSVVLKGPFHVSIFYDSMNLYERNDLAVTGIKCFQKLNQSREAGLAFHMAGSHEAALAS